MSALYVATLSLYDALAFLVPVGLALLAIGAAREDRAQEVARTALLAVAAAFVGYFACGFALQFGGVGLVSGMPGLQNLTAEWSPLDLAWGPGWGVIGLRGFFLIGEAYEPDAYLLFASQLPAVTTAVLAASLALCNRLKSTHLAVIGLLISAFIYPLFNNWVWGGGWLANLGVNLELGHGFLDAAGSAGVFLLGSLVALSVVLATWPMARKPLGQTDAAPDPPRLPPVHFPLLMVVGAALALCGWAGLVLGNPLLGQWIQAPMVMVNLALAAAAGAGLSAAYCWFVTGEADALTMARGMVAGLVSAGAACALIPAWTALVIGGIAGLLLPLGLYLWDVVLRLDDPGAAMVTYGLPAVWGSVAVAIFADGRWGAGWNGVGVEEYLKVASQGVTGLVLAAGYQPAGAAQLYAQLAGLGALLVAALLLPWLMLRACLWIHATARPARPAPEAPPQPSSARKRKRSKTT
jgi:Amt family ammonium transporter